MLTEEHQALVEGRTSAMGRIRLSEDHPRKDMEQKL